MSSNIEFRNTPITDLYILKRKIASDDRGYFYRLFCYEELKEIGLSKPIAQINYSHAKGKYVTKGFHFQYPPYAETKIVTCVKGEIFDVAVDLRSNSSTFLNWFGIILSEENKLSFFIPEGFAHGFQSLSDESGLIYLHTEAYSSADEGGLSVLDPAIGVKWPHPPQLLSARDSSFLNINSNFKGINIHEMQKL